MFDHILGHMLIESKFSIYYFNAGPFSYVGQKHSDNSSIPTASENQRELYGKVDLDKKSAMIFSLVLLCNITLY